MTRWTCCWYMVHVRKLTREHDRGGPNGQLPGFDWQSLPRPCAITFGPHRRCLLWKKSLVANLSAKRQLSVAKLSTKRIFSPAKRDFLVANGRMAADFSSPDTLVYLFLPLPTQRKNKKQSSLRMFAAGRVSNQLLVSHERSGRAKCI